MRMMVREKNSDELFQNAVWASYAGDPSRAKQDGVVPVTKEDAKKDVDQGTIVTTTCPFVDFGTDHFRSCRTSSSFDHTVHHQL